MDLLFNQLFHLPFITGLALALALPVLGAYLRMRSEWLAVLGLSQMTAAGASLGVIIQLPLVLVGFFFAMLSSLLKLLLLYSGSRKRGNDYYAFLIIFGWSLMLLFSSFSYEALSLSQALIDGQIYFITQNDLVLALGLVVALIIILPMISQRLLIGRFFPDYFYANQASPWPHRILFEFLVVSGVVIATISLGIMSTFALVFIPPLIAFTFVNGWKVAVTVSISIGVIAYLCSFIVALKFDLPFGPVQVLSLSIILAIAFLSRRRPVS